MLNKPGDQVHLSALTTVVYLALATCRRGRQRMQIIAQHMNNLFSIKRAYQQEVGRFEQVTLYSGARLQRSGYRVQTGRAPANLEIGTSSNRRSSAPKSRTTYR